MPKCDELLRRARANPAGLRFAQLCQLAECHGFQFARQRGSHRVYRHATARTIMTFQEVNGMAKPYQVRQLLDVIDDLTDQGE